MRRWDSLVDRYLARCVIRGLSKSTIMKRRSELDRFGGWLKRRKPKISLEQVDGDLVVRYLQERAVFRSRATLSGVISDLRVIGEHLVHEGVWQRNPLRWIRGPKMDRRRRLPKRIGAETLKALWSAAQERRDVYSRYLAVCLLSVLYGTGIRAGELERLDLDDWDSGNAILQVDGRKTGKPRNIAVGEGVWRCIEAYLPHRHNQLEKSGRIEERALVVNRVGKRVNKQNIHTLLKRLVISAGVPNVTLHQFRHSCASDLLEAGVPLPQVQKFLGHAAISSTVRYVDVADPARSEAMILSKTYVNLMV